MLRALALVAFGTAIVVSSACQRGIGDGCETALNCSASATRLCDTTQPGGYCTLAGCQGKSCPPEAICVTFWQNTDRDNGERDRNRLSVNYCMLKCDETSDCRDGEGYKCFRGNTFGVMGEAHVEADPKQGFCAVRLKVAVDAGPMSMPTDGDAGL